MPTSSFEATVADRLHLAIASRDFPGLANCFHEEVRFRALVPRGLREASDAQAAASYFQTWFGSADRVQAVHQVSEDIGNKKHLTWRLQIESGTETTIVEQQAFVTVTDDRITQLDLVCSGFQPVSVTHPVAAERC